MKSEHRTKRISAIADWIDCSVLADVGSDHGLLCILALQQHKAKKAYAIDISDKPLKQARKNIEKAGLKEKIETRVENGLENLEEDVDQIVMAGLGAATMMEILERNPTDISLLLSPHKDVIELRAWLADHHYQIVREKMIEDSHFYPLLEVKKTKERQPLDVEDLYCGKNVEPSVDYLSFLKREYQIWKEREPKLSQEKQKEIRIYLDFLTNRLTKVEKVLNQ